MVVHGINVEAKWSTTRSLYVADVERHGDVWYSGDGTNWTYDDGVPVSGPIFDAVCIRLCGGPRSGKVVS